MSDVKAAVRTLKLFELFAQRREPLVLTELAQALEIPPSSCLLLVRTLLDRGYLYESARRSGYYPTRRMLDCATQIVAHDSVIDRLRPHLEQLRDETRETVTLAKVQGTKLIYLDVVDSGQVVRPVIGAGTLRPLHSTATGKALLSLLDVAARNELLDEAGLPRLTSRTITSKSKLQAEIELGLERGWFSNDGESVPELGAIAVPIEIGSEGYAVTVMGPSSRLLAGLNRHAATLLRAKARLGKAFDLAVTGR